MSQLPLFVSGLESANLVVSSDLLHLSCSAARALNSEVNEFQQQYPFPHLSVRCKIYGQQNCIVIAFVTSPSCTIQHLEQGGDLVSSATLKQHNLPLFDFLCSTENPAFSINRAAIELFASHLGDLSQLKTEIHDSRASQLSVNTPLIITGHSLGGSVAALFTLWLLDSINQLRKRNEPPAKLPLCITFGSPFIGDEGFGRAIAERSKWNSCFLHVAAIQDTFPRHFVSVNNPTIFAPTAQIPTYKPFGTFFLCSQEGSTCIENPKIVAKLLDSTRSQVSYQELTIDYYGQIMDHLKSTLIVRANSQLSLSDTNPLRAGISLQLEAIGVTQQQQQGIDIDNLIREIEELEKIHRLDQRKTMDPSKKLNEVKIKMAYLEWYKKDSKAKLIGYYDCYKNQRAKSDREVTKIKKYLTNYWNKMVKDAAKKPQKEGAFIRMTWLYAGTNYRRMVEPLVIAEYYRESGKKGDYRKKGRPEHFILLEKWQKKDAEKPAGKPTNKKKQNVAGNLTEDSCFWADVEKALISCRLLKDQSSSGEEKKSATDFLIKFVGDVMDQINNYAVSPEIFLGGSSFMKWWEEFQGIIGSEEFQGVIGLRSSSLVDFMKNNRYYYYEQGRF